MLFRRKNNARQIDLPPLSFCASNTEGLRAWAQSLPHNNVSLLAKQLVTAVDELYHGNPNDTQLSSAHEILEPLLLNVAAELTLYKPSKIKRVENLQQQRVFFFATGRLFADAAVEQLNQKNAKSRLSLTHAVDFFVRALFASNQLYAKPVEGNWLATHRSYALWSKLSRDKKIDTKHKSDIAENPEHKYRAIIALNCLGPNTVNPQKIDQLFTFLCEEHELIKLSNADDQASHFISPNSDTPPQKISLVGTPKDDGSAVLYVNISELHNDALLSKYPDFIAAQLRENLSAPIKRSSARLTLTETFDVCAGLNSIHYKVSGDQTLAQFIRPYNHLLNAGSATFDAIATDTKVDDVDVWSTVYKGNWEQKNLSGDAVEFNAPCMADKKPSQACLDFTCTEANDCSLAGLKISGSCPKLANFLPGSLIAVSKPNSSDWSLATIRWTKADNKSRQLGMMYIGHRVTPSAIKIVHSKHGTEFLPSFIIDGDTIISSLDDASKVAPAPSSSTMNSNYYVIIPNLNIQTKFTAVVLANGHEARLIFDECLEQTDEYCIYRLPSESE